MNWSIGFWHWLAHAAMGVFVILAVSCLALRLCRQPAQRLRIAELTLLGCLLVPWLDFIPGLPHFTLGWLEPPAAQTAALVTRTEETLPAIPSRQPLTPVATQEPVAAPVIESAGVVVAPALPPSLSPVTAPAFPPWIKMPATGPLFALAYLALTSGFVIRWLVGMIKLWVLCRSSCPAEGTVLDVLEQIAGPGAGRVRLWVSEAIDLPLTFGWRRPVIVLPGSLCRSGDEATLRYCLAHEWSHVERGDIVGWHLAALAQLLCFYQPLFWWLRRQLRLCQDYLADARAAEQAGSAEDYASFLVTLARRQWAAPEPAALGLGDRRSNLYRRVVMLVTPQQPLERRCRPLWTAAAALATVVLLAGIAGIRLDAHPRDDAPTPTPKEASKGDTRAQAITYTGRVFDKVTDKGIAGATVTVRRTTYGDPKGEKTLQETKHQTDGAGKYTLTITPEQAAEKYLYIELDVEAPGYAPRSHFGYALSMIQKNEKMGGRPFFENVDMRAAKEITGLVQTPEGKPAAGVPLLAYSNAEKQDGFEYGSFANAKTDAAGRFRLWLVTPGPAVFWLLPDNYAPSTHVLKDYNKRGDLGQFKLQPGLILKGRVLDTRNKPVAGVFVHADRRGGIEDFHLPVADNIRRTARTDDQGAFTMAPLPAGTYEVMPEERGWEPGKEESRHRVTPLPGVFVRQPVVLKEGQEPEPVDLRAVPAIFIEAQYYDSKGQPTRGHASHLFGRMDKNNYWFGEGKMDANGKMIIQAPHGLTDASLQLVTNEHGALRYRLKKGDPLRAGRQVNLGTLNDDVKGIEIIRYVAPILIVDARDKNAKQLKDFQVKVAYASDALRKPKNESFVNGVQGDVYLEKQEDGRWRTNQMLPDEEVAVTVSAKGYKPHTEKMKFAEGATKELSSILEKQ
jgi:hypothetical protein